MKTVKGDDGLIRCEWGSEPRIYRDYHDREWGRPTTSDILLFEKICLEGFQAGLSWLTILRKREAFREAFAGFDPVRVSSYTDSDISRLLQDPRIVRHQGKIRSTINNAGRALDLIEDAGSLSGYFWSWAEPESPPPDREVAASPVSTALAKDLKKRGWTFVGPTTVYAFMQAMGLVNDHLRECDVREECSVLRRMTLGSTI